MPRASSEVRPHESAFHAVPSERRSQRLLRLVLRKTSIHHQRRAGLKRQVAQAYLCTQRLLRGSTTVPRFAGSRPLRCNRKAVCNLDATARTARQGRQEVQGPDQLPTLAAWKRTYSSRISQHRYRTGNGPCTQRKAGCIWLWSSTCTHGW